MLSLDRKIFEKDSAVRTRIIEYGGLFRTLHVIVFTLERHEAKPEQLAPNVWVYPTHSWSKLDYLMDTFVIARAELLVQGKLMADVITAQGPEAGLIGYFLAKKYERRLQLQLHGETFSPHFDSAIPFNGLRRLITNWLVPRASCVRVVSKREQAELEKRFPSMKERISFLPIYVDIEHYKNTERAFDLHDKYPDFPFIILMSTRLTSEKNVGFALEVFAQVLGHYRRAGLLIAGDGPERRALEKKARELGIRENVVFMGWQEDMISCYKSANLFLHTSRYEGYGMALVEAAACGIPIVTSDVGIASELKNEQGGAMVCPVDDRECFVREIVAFLNDNTRRLFSHFAVEQILQSGVAATKEEYLAAYQKSIERCF